MLIPDWAWQTLLESGFRVDAVDDETVDLWAVNDDGTRVAIEAKVFYRPRTIGPADIRALVERMSPERPHVLVLASAISKETQADLDRLKWSWIAGSQWEQPRGVIRVPSSPAVKISPTDPRRPLSNRRRGPVPYGSFALMRTLLSNPRGRTQTELASRTGLTQPRVSQVMNELHDQGLAGRRGRTHWVTTDWQGLLEHFMTQYPGPGGVTTYWYGLDSVEEQTQAALRVLDASALSRGEGDTPVVSADPAAEYISAWRRPQRALIYSRRGESLDRAGLTPSGPREATLLLTVPKDLSVWPDHGDDVLRLAPGAPFAIANPVQIIWDLSRESGPDADQAAERVKAALADDYQSRISR